MQRYSQHGICIVVLEELGESAHFFVVPLSSFFLSLLCNKPGFFLLAGKKDVLSAELFRACKPATLAGLEQSWKAEQGERSKDFFFCSE